jgi:hypothetical protein
MPTDKPRFLVSRCYSIVTPESARIGDTAENGFVFEREPMSLAQAVDELRDCVELSAWPIRSPRDLNGHEWAETEMEPEDYSSADERQESVHFRNIRGGNISPANLFRLFCLAGLISR